MKWCFWCFAASEAEYFGISEQRLFCSVYNELKHLYESFEMDGLRCFGVI